MSNFPTSKDSPKNDWNNNDYTVDTLATQLNLLADAIIAIQDKVGIDSSADITTLDYGLRNPSSISIGHKHVLDDNIDVDTTGVADGNFLVWVDANSQWEPSTSSTANASTTVAGKVEQATVAEIDAGTATGGTGAILFADPANLASSIYGTRLPTSDEKDALAGTGTPNSTNKYVTNDDVASAATASKIARRNATGDVTVPTTPSASTDAASKSYVDGLIVGYKTGVTTRAGDAATGSQNIAHGLGATPDYVRIVVTKSQGTSASAQSNGAYDGTNTSCVYWNQATGSSIAGNDSTNVVVIYEGATTKQEATISVDGTNITLSWTKTGSPNANNMNIMWEAIG